MLEIAIETGINKVACVLDSDWKVISPVSTNDCQDIRVIKRELGRSPLSMKGEGCLRLLKARKWDVATVYLCCCSRYENH